MSISTESANAASEAVHLRRIIETQPACLMRVALDGVLLAANDAALGLLGAADHSQVIGSLLTTWIVPEDLGRWREFAATVGQGTSVSLECDITDLSGAHRNVAFYAVPLIDHHDEIPSMILGARDESGLRRLEASLREAAARRQEDLPQPAQAHADDDQEWQDLRTQLQQSTTEREELAALLVDSESAHQALLAEREGLQQALAKQSQLEQLLKAGRTHLQELRRRVEEAETERQRLATQLSERDAAHNHLAAEQTRQGTQVEQQQRDLLVKEKEAQQHLDGVRARLEEIIAGRDQLAARLSELETAHSGLVAEHADLGTVAEAHQQDARSREQEAQQQLDLLRTQLEEATTERDRVILQLDQRETAHQQLMAEQTNLQHTLAEQQQQQQDLLSREQDAQHHLNRLRTHLEDAIAERDGLVAQLGERETAHQRLMDEQAELQKALADQHELEALLKEQEALHEANDLRAQLEASAAEQHRLATLLDERDTLHRQAVADHDAERSLFEQSLEISAVVQDRMKKSLADHHVELQSMDLITRQLAPLAATGRLALQIGNELLDVVAAIDARAAGLLADCPLESGHRKEIEELRSDAISAAALARQMVRADTQPAEVREFSTSGESV